MNIEGWLINAKALQDFAINRAEQFLRSNGIVYKMSFEGIEFNDNNLVVTFEEDCNREPESDYVCLTLQQLSMSDSEWYADLEERKRQRKAKEEEELKGYRQARIEEAKRKLDWAQAEYQRTLELNKLHE